MRIRDGEINFAFDHMLVLFPSHRSLPTKRTKAFYQVHSPDRSKSHASLLPRYSSVVSMLMFLIVISLAFCGALRRPSFGALTGTIVTTRLFGS